MFSGYVRVVFSFAKNPVSSVRARPCKRIRRGINTGSLWTTYEPIQYHIENLASKEIIFLYFGIFHLSIFIYLFAFLKTPN
jgi:hypothetical protein